MKITEKKVASKKGDITLYRLENSHGCAVELSSLGAGILAVEVPDAKGVIENVALSYADPTDYYYDGPCLGKIPGRFANRIKKGHFTLDGKEYQLAINNGGNALHGGPEGFQNQIWQSQALPDGVRFTYTSAAGEEGYPGKLTVVAEYHWSEDDVLDLRITAVTDAPTILNLTNHAYWNLAGADSGSVLGHKLRVNASRYIVGDSELCPTGELAPVEGTPLDFREAKEIGRDIKADFDALRYGKGYDFGWVVDREDDGSVVEAVELTDEKSGRRLVISSTCPDAHVYTGNWLAGSPKNRSGRSYEDYDGVAVELQRFPDAPNHPGFPSTVLRPGELFDERIRFAFSSK